MTVFGRYPHFTAFAAVTLTVGGAGLTLLHPARALLIGFDSGAVVFLMLLLRKFRTDKADAMRRRAARNEPDHHVLTGLALFITGIVVTAVWVELTGEGGQHATGIALAATSLALAWLFANSLFALHYAHIYYLKSAGADLAGLDFPGHHETPDYWDFAYFAFVLGMTFQVSDVQITSGRVRRLALLHGLLAFLYNIAVVALSVSLVATAFGR
ncbi:MAG: DUF1345 domain-containing protein [Polymorphobacter sp.]